MNEIQAKSTDIVKVCKREGTLHVRSRLMRAVIEEVNTQTGERLALGPLDTLTVSEVKLGSYRWITPVTFHWAWPWYKRLYLEARDKWQRWKWRNGRERNGQ